MSNRINNMDISPMNKYYEISNKIVEAGTKVYNLSSAQPNVQPDSSYYQALKDIPENINGYSDCRGLEVLRNEFAKYYNNKIQMNKFTQPNSPLKQQKPYTHARAHTVTSCPSESGERNDPHFPLSLPSKS